MRTILSILFLSAVFLAGLWYAESQQHKNPPSTPLDHSEEISKTNPNNDPPDSLGTPSKPVPIQAENRKSNSVTPIIINEATFTNLGSLTVDADSDGFSTSDEPVQNIGRELNADLQELVITEDEPVNIGKFLDPDSIDQTYTTNPPVNIGAPLDAEQTSVQTSNRTAENIGDPTLPPPAD